MRESWGGGERERWGGDGMEVGERWQCGERDAIM